jgi:Short C-terminal domain
MGLFHKLLGALGGGNRVIDNGVRGTAQVVSCSAYRGRGVWQNCHLQLVVQADSIPATAVEIDTLAHNQRWPMPGMTLPVTIDSSNHYNVRIEWDDVQSSRDRSRLTAEALAAAMRGEGGGISGAVPGGATVVNLSGQDLSQLSEDKKAKLRMLGIDPNALAAAQAGAAPGGTSDNDHVSKLERLAKLHETGALTDAEFEAEKKKVLEN